MPAIVRWPGHVKAGSITGELAATYDIFTTMLTMAAVPLPSDRIIDGKDLSPIIFVRSAVSRAASTYILSCALTRSAAMMQGTGKSQHECIFNYHTGQLLAVVRCGDYKLHFDGQAPRLYDLIQDVHEDQPLDYKSDASLQAVFDKITAARTAHLATVVPVVDQILLGYDDDYALCGAPDSQVRAAASVCSCWMSLVAG